MDNNFHFFNLLSVLFCIIAASSFFIAKFKVKFEESVAVCITAIVLLLYFFGLFGVLKYGLYVVNSLIFISTLYALFHVRKEKTTFFKNLLTPGFFLYLVWCFGIYLCYRDQMITLHDDFSHWALAAKNTYVLDAIAAGKNATTIYQDYPPATALLQYWLTNFTRNFCEPLVLLSMSIWGFSVLCYPSRYLNWTHYKAISLYAVCGFIIPFAFRYEQPQFNSFYEFLMVDYLLAILFGYSLTLAAESKKDMSRFEIFRLLLAIMVMPLVKKVGIFLALPVLVITVYRIFDMTNKKVFLKRAALFIITLVLVVKSWSRFCRKEMVELSSVNNGFSIALTKIFSLSQAFPEKTGDVFKLYINALLSLSVTNGILHMSVAIYFLAIMGFSYFYFRSAEPLEKKNALRIFQILFVFLITHIIGHSFMYLFVLSDGEAYRLSSFLRYLLFFTAGIFIFLLNSLLRSGFQNHNQKARTMSFVVMLMILLTAIKFEAPKTKAEKEAEFPILAIQQKEVKDLASLDTVIQKYFEPHSNRFLCFFEGESGTTYGLALLQRYKYVPLHVSRILSWEPANEHEAQWKDSKFNDDLKKCDYLFLIGLNNTLVKNFSKFFTSRLEEHGFYEIVKNENNVQSLKLKDCSLCNGDKSVE